MASAELIQVLVAYSPAPREVDLVSLQIPAGTCAVEAVRLSGLIEKHELQLSEDRLGVWMRACPPSTPLRDADRVEIYRDLKVDPKEARRQRYHRQAGGR